MGDRLDARSIVDSAVEQTGIDDIGDDWFLTPLAAWSDDLHGDNLTNSGRAFLRRLAVSDVARRLEVLQEIRDHPAILDVEIPPIVYITGLERSGTTLLHNLLALHTTLRPLLRWELMRPVPPPDAATYSTDPRIAAAQASIEPLRGSMLERMHWVNADEPEECTWGMIDMVGLLGQATRACMPAWSRFLEASDMTRAFEHYRQVIQLLLWKNPAPVGGGLVLKAPQTSNNLHQFAAVFPEARFVIPDRDPYRVVTSTMVMVASLMDAFCVDNPVRVSMGGGLDWPATTGRRLADIARFGDDEPDRIVHIPYPSLARSPRASALSLVDTLQLPSDPQFGDAIDHFIAGQHSGKRASPPKHLEELGVGRDELMAVPSIAAYCERFGIEPEAQRLTGAAPSS